jgi:ceramide glucosyltransferase
MPLVTILKPVCGLEPGLSECLRSFFEQDYPEYQIVFGVRSASDPALAVLEALRREYPHRDVALVVDGRLHGSNRKMSNLANMLGAARHGILVISDSDVRVARDYLLKVVAPFAEPRVGAVTGLYTGASTGSLPSTLGAMFINDWFLPTILLAVRLRRLDFCFGQTMAVRRDVLDSIGGFQAIAPYLADDYVLGQLVAGKGFEVRLADPGLENLISDSRFPSLLRRELRWSRTYRIVRPASYRFSTLTDTTALALIALLVSGGSSFAFALFGATLLVRFGTHAAVRRRFHPSGPDRTWLVPFQDLLFFAIRVGSFLGRRVEWRGEEFVVLSSGRLETKVETP